jgi:hypothetical protein
MPRKVFISYRRMDARYPAQQIYATFCKALSSDNVFMDIHSIPPGVDFVKLLEGWVDQCDVMLALIGSDWIKAVDPKTGSRRLDNETDFVRVEIRRGLKRGIRVVPVLLDGATMPEAGQLPGDLKAIVHLNAALVEFRTFDADVARLIENLGLSGSSRSPGETATSDDGGHDRSASKQVFVSYPKDVEPAVLKRIVSNLIDGGLRIWMHDPTPYAFSDRQLDKIQWQGSSLRNEASQAAKNSDAVLFLISRSTLQSLFQHEELAVALKNRCCVPCIVDQGLRVHELPAKLSRFRVRKITERNVDDDQALKALATQVARVARAAPKIGSRLWSILICLLLIIIVSSVFLAVAAR